MCKTNPEATRATNNAIPPERITFSSVAETELRAASTAVRIPAAYRDRRLASGGENEVITLVREPIFSGPSVGESSLMALVKETWMASYRLRSVASPERPIATFVYFFQETCAACIS